MEYLYVPLLNANEDEVDVVEVRCTEGEKVAIGDILVVVESTKATLEIESPASGYVRNLTLTNGKRVKVDALVCVITETLEEEVAVETAVDSTGTDVRATKKARAMAAHHNIDLTTLGVSGIVKERDVLAAIGTLAATHFDSISGFEVVIYGGGGHAKVLIDIMRESYRDWRIVGIVDDGNAPPSEVLGVKVVGDSSQLDSLKSNGATMAVLGVGAVTNNKIRIELYNKLVDGGFVVPNLIHAKSMVEPSARMGFGNQLFAGSIVSSDVILGHNTIINSGVVVSHDCKIGSHTHLTPGAILAGNVTVGENTVIGMGSTVYLGVTIGSNCVIANGVHVMADVPDNTVVRANS